jgi:2-oxoglutarate ferredoxin oxidoreductase subunit alpha
LSLVTPELRAAYCRSSRRDLGCAAHRTQHRLLNRTSQGDLTFTNFIGHGDSDSVILLPGGVDECFEFGWRAFDVAEQVQTPVFVLSDLDMGMNQWMSKPFEYPNTPMQRGKVLWEKDLEELKGNWARYLDKDGDGVPYRTVPGNRHPTSSYFTRGTGHDENARYTEDSSMWLKNMERLKKKYETARKYVPAPVLYTRPAAKVGVSGLAPQAAIEASISSTQNSIRQIPAPARPSLHPGSNRFHQPIRSHLRCRDEPRWTNETDLNC